MFWWWDLVYIYIFESLAPYRVKNFQIHLIMNRAMALNPKNVYTKSEIDCLKTLAFIAVRPNTDIFNENESHHVPTRLQSGRDCSAGFL